MELLHTFAGRPAVISGAGSGIGEALAKEFALTYRMHVLVTDIHESDALRVAQVITDQGGKATGFQLDVTDDAATQHFAMSAVQQFGVPALLACNAGIEYSGYLWEMDPQDWDRVLGVGLDGVFHLTHAFLPEMLRVEASGHILITSSIGGLGASANQGAYTVSKHGSRAFGESLAADLLDVESDIGVSILLPAAVQTPIFSRAATSGAVGAEKHRVKFEEALASQGITPEETARITCHGINEGALYIHTHEDRARVFINRFTAALEESLAPCPTE